MYLEMGRDKIIDAIIDTGSSLLQPRLKDVILAYWLGQYERSKKANLPAEDKVEDFLDDVRGMADDDDVEYIEAAFDLMEAEAGGMTRHKDKRGREFCMAGGKRVACGGPKPVAAPKPPRAKAEPKPKQPSARDTKAKDAAAAKVAASSTLKELMDDPGKITQDAVNGLLGHLGKLPVADIKALRDKLGAKGGASKAELSNRIKMALLVMASKPTPKTEPKPEPAPAPTPSPAVKPTPAPTPTAKTDPAPQPAQKPAPTPPAGKTSPRPVEPTKPQQKPAQAQQPAPQGKPASPEVERYRKTAALAAKLYAKDRAPLSVDMPATRGDLVARTVGEAGHAGLMKATAQAYREGKTSLGKGEMAKAMNVPLTHPLVANLSADGLPLTVIARELGTRGGRVDFRPPQSGDDLGQVQRVLDTLKGDARDKVLAYLGLAKGTETSKAVSQIRDRVFPAKANPRHIAEQIEGDTVSADLHTRAAAMASKAAPLNARAKELNTRLKTLNREIGKLADFINDTGNSVAARTAAKVRGAEALAEYKKLAAEEEDVHNRREALAKEFHDHMREALTKARQGKPAAEVTYARVDSTAAKLDDGGRAEALKAVGFYRGLVSAGPGHEELANTTLTVAAGSNARPFFTQRRGAGGGKQVVASSSTEAKTHAHELAHGLEELPHVRAAARAFLDHRCGNEKPTRMKDVSKNPDAYDDDETGRKDNFEAALGHPFAYYAGMVYQDGATEVVSMGVEKLYDDPAGFAAADPEYFRFIVGLMSGTTRRNPS